MAHMTARSLDDALAALGEGARILAGGTDFFPALGERPATFPIVDITRAAGLRGIVREEDGWRIGAATTWTDLVRAPLPAAFDGLKAAAHEVGSIQIQNTGTIAGNLCNASPAADGVPCLLALDAVVELASQAGRRRLPLADFITGVRATALGPGEMMTAILVPDQPEASVSGFSKLGARRYLVISIAMVAAVVVPDGEGRVACARVAVGACSPVARRLPALEAALVGAPVDEMAGRVVADQLAPLSPIDDVRGTAEYRSDAVLTLIRRVLAGLSATGAAA